MGNLVGEIDSKSASSHEASRREDTRPESEAICSSRGRLEEGGGVPLRK